MLMITKHDSGADGGWLECRLSTLHWSKLSFAAVILYLVVCVSQ